MILSQSFKWYVSIKSLPLELEEPCERRGRKSVKTGGHQGQQENKALGIS